MSFQYVGKADRNASSRIGIRRVWRLPAATVRGRARRIRRLPAATVRGRAPLRDATAAPMTCPRATLGDATAAPMTCPCAANVVIRPHARAAKTPSAIHRRAVMMAWRRRTWRTWRTWRTIDRRAKCRRAGRPLAPKEKLRCFRGGRHRGDHHDAVHRVRTFLECSTPGFNGELCRPSFGAVCRLGTLIPNVIGRHQPTDFQ